MGEISAAPAGPPSPFRVLNLLDLEPGPRTDEGALHQTLAFAFATGDIGDALAQVVDGVRLPPSAWEPKDFAADVFLPVLVERAFPVTIEGRSYPRSSALLRRLFGAPPRDPRVVAMRQGIFAELVDRPDLRRGIELFYKELFHLRALLSRTTATRVDPFERRLAVLRALRDAAAIAAHEIQKPASALKRVASWGKSVVASDGYRRLLELLAYEEGAAELDLRVRLGFDGKIRALAVTAKRELETATFPMRPSGRFAARVGLFFRGYDFSLHELFARMADEVFEGLVDLFLPVFPFVGDLEFYLAGLGFRDRLLARRMAVCLPVLAEDQGFLLAGLTNPLLADEARVVPCDVSTEAADARVIVTGPNSGGKTRLLQAVAIAQILGQAGCFVPAKLARLPWASGLFVSLIEQAQADQREGRLGTELLRIRRLFESLRAGSLVILDELCSGTNPSEGEEIFRLVVKLLGELRPSAFITTHFLSFARRLSEEDPTLEFLQVELLGEEPTFRFVPGVATTSLAHKTAIRLGVTEEALRALVAGRQPRTEVAPVPDAARENEGAEGPIAVTACAAPAV